MAAESKDAERVYKDQQAIKGEKKDIAADKPGSLQMKSDKAALQKRRKADAGRQGDAESRQSLRQDGGGVQGLRKRFTRTSRPSRARRRTSPPTGQG